VQKILAVFKRACEKGGGAMPSEAEVKAMVAAADLDKDGYLNEDELGAVMMACA